MKIHGKLDTKKLHISRPRSMVLLNSGLDDNGLEAGQEDDSRDSNFEFQAPNQALSIKVNLNDNSGSSNYSISEIPGKYLNEGKPVLCPPVFETKPSTFIQRN